MNRGQMLLEVTIAVGVMVLVLVAAAKLTTQSIKTSRIRIDRQQASKMANACLNLARQEKDSNIAEYFSEGYDFKTKCDCSKMPTAACAMSFSLVNTPEGAPKQVYVEAFVSWYDNDIIQYESNSVTFTQVSLL